LTLGIALLLFDNLFDLLLLSIGKDVSLTGRTLLWSHAANIIADHPFGGLGLQAFWVEGNSEAVRFWETFYIDSHIGFHFHDLWLETGVELGFIGIFNRRLDDTRSVFQRLAMGVARKLLRQPK
jgi:exopolysaccharide production protein ExoQ